MRRTTIVLALLTFATEAISANLPRVLATRTTKADAQGRFERVTIEEADFKYPLRRVREVLQRDDPGGHTRTVRRVAMVADHILVKLQPGATEASLRQLCAQHGAAIRRRSRVSGLYLVSLGAADLDAVPRAVATFNAATDVVLRASPDTLLTLDDTTPNDPRYSELWAMPRIEAPQAWDYHTGTGGTVVAVLDTGIDYNHQDLAANMWRNPGEIPANSIDDDGNGYVDDVYGWDFYNDDANPYDDNGHGTRCAGSVAAVGENGVGVVGVTWRAKLMAVKFVSASGDADILDAIESVAYVTAFRTNGIPVRTANASWHYDEFPQDLYDAMAAAGDAGVLCLAAAANDGVDIEGFDDYYPANFDLDSVIAVANSKKDDALYSSSNYGTNRVDLAAPGYDILTTAPGNAYASATGTSRSAPYVTGTAALLWDALPGLTVSEVRAAILGGVDAVPALQDKVATGGRLNVHKALLRIPPAVVHVPLQNSTNTTYPHELSAQFVPEALVDTNQLVLHWSTNGTMGPFTAEALLPGTNAADYVGSIPAAPLGSEISYYLSAASLGGSTRTDPAGAPGTAHTFRVVEPVSLVVTGSPAALGTVSPDYGTHLYPSGVTVTASAPDVLTPAEDTRYVSTGWTGDGSVPPTGSVAEVTFAIGAPSTVSWQWATMYSLSETSTIPGLVGSATWWPAGATAETSEAASPFPMDSTNYRFAHWTLSGERLPDPSNTAVNPAIGIAMYTGRVATAIYLPDEEDGDLDAMPDWWELFYFGSTNVPPGTDADGDGHENREEQAAGTDPRDSSSVLAFQNVTGDPATGSVVVSWVSVEDRQYGLFTSTNLAEPAGWTAIAGYSNIHGSGGMLAVTVSVDQAEQRLFRVEVEGP